MSSSPRPIVQRRSATLLQLPQPPTSRTHPSPTVNVCIAIASAKSSRPLPSLGLTSRATSNISRLCALLTAVSSAIIPHSPWLQTPPLLAVSIDSPDLVHLDEPDSAVRRMPLTVPLTTTHEIGPTVASCCPPSCRTAGPSNELGTQQHSQILLPTVAPGHCDPLITFQIFYYSSERQSLVRLPLQRQQTLAPDPHAQQYDRDRTHLTSLRAAPL